MDENQEVAEFAESISGRKRKLEDEERHGDDQEADNEESENNAKKQRPNDEQDDEQDDQDDGEKAAAAGSGGDAGGNVNDEDMPEASGGKTAMPGGELDADEDAEEHSFDLSSDDDEDEDEDEPVRRGRQDEGANRVNHDKESKEDTTLTSSSSGDKDKTDKNSSDKSGKVDELGKGETEGDQARASTSAQALNNEQSSKEYSRRKKQEQLEEESKKMQVLMANFSEEQLNRYEIFRRSAFQKSTVKKIIQTVCGKNVSQSVVIAMSGVAKVFVGEIVEKALDVKEKWGDEGPLQPKHLREAYRLFKSSNKLSDSYKYKRNSLF